MTTKFSSDLSFGDQVFVDDVRTGVTARIVGFAVYARGVQVQVSWWNNGALVEHWVDEWRIKRMP